MILAARPAGGRMAYRDALLIVMAYRHGLRASELIALRWDQVDLKAGTLHVARLKHGSPNRTAFRACLVAWSGRWRTNGAVPSEHLPDGR
jgi:type 1 fimbriae regulatory protein FimB/type 1 fimbriae regulatory protein FimE